MLRIGQIVADISLKTTAGDFGVHEYFGGRWEDLIYYDRNNHDFISRDH